MIENMKACFQLNNLKAQNLDKRPFSPNRFVNLNGKIFELNNFKKQVNVVQKQKQGNNISIQINDPFQEKLPKNNNFIEFQKNKQKQLKVSQISEKHKLQIEQAYQQLKARQLEYLAIIKELFIQNQTLKKINQQLKNHQKQAKIPQKQQTKFLSIAQTQKKMINQNQTNILTQMDINNQQKQINLININNKEQSQTNILTNFQKENCIYIQNLNKFHNQNIQQSQLIKQISNRFQSQRLIQKPLIDQFWKQVQGENEHHSLKKQGKNNKKQVTFVDSLYNSKQLISRQYLNDIQLDNCKLSTQQKTNFDKNNQIKKQKSIGDIISTCKTLYQPTFKYLNNFQKEEYFVDNIEVNVNNVKNIETKQTSKIIYQQSKGVKRRKLRNNDYLI